ncbi:peptidylprolyl isomerase [Acidovorax sp. GBBC 3334]|uniref:peptidylprolyl isomerase n=1 Tax=unclassified Acidovorax TaxID=2684926 RepID=UPI002303FBCD|nr:MULTISPECIES: peptidylprolyl isomerase [unclassified Acidovorax]MDA8455010.1 peptidylprolyl isomerase [Acidovorax sp. GBBC 3334]MDA8523380.1 peptidylprolyl isomerase [Acidovorax sp. NCPPB 4044]
MNHRAFTLGLACTASAIVFLAPAVAGAQGLRTPGGSGLSAPAAAPSLRSAPNITLPAPGAASRGTPSTRQADYIVAVVNTEPLTNNEVQARLSRVEQQLATQGGERPSRQVLAREVMERLINEKIQVQMATESGIKVDDYAIAQAEQSVARQNNVSIDEMHRRLAADGISPERFRAELRNQLLVQRLRERDVEGRVRVSDIEVDQYMREQQQSTATDFSKIELNLGHILITVPENATPDVVEQRRQRAQQAADKVRGGEDFGEVAREFSDAAERSSGGQLGLRPADRYPELFLRSTQQLPVGGIAGPVRSPAGFHVLKVIERSRAGIPVTAVQTHARHILLRAGPQVSESASAERLAEYRRRIEAGQADFATLAREHSQDGSAKQGGDLGWAGPGRYVPEFEEVLETLKPGEISQPVATRFGVHLIQLLERREAKLTQREQRDMVRDTVREKKLDEAFATWAQEARARAYVEYRDPPQ